MYTFLQGVAFLDYEGIFTIHPRVLGKYNAEQQMDGQIPAIR
jgi:hypothetical protein